MRKKHCVMHERTVHAGVCYECGLLVKRVEGENIFWECPNLLEKVVFVGPTSGQDRDNSVGQTFRYRYNEADMRGIAETDR